MTDTSTETTSQVDAPATEPSATDTGPGATVTADPAELATAAAPTADPVPESLVDRVEDAVETVVEDVGRWLRHVETGIVGLVTGGSVTGGNNPDPSVTTTIAPVEGDPFTAPSSEFVDVPPPVTAAASAE